MDKFTEAYIECALWASTDEEGEPLDMYQDIDIAPESLAAMVADCEAFQRDNADDLAELDDRQAGHDFWLTRNGHGAGFWDRGLGELGDRLSKAAHVYGSSDLYVGDDGTIYVV